MRYPAARSMTAHVPHRQMDKLLRIAGTISESIVDGPGFRYVIFTQGCPHRCSGCHNPETHDFAGGHLIEPDVLVQDILKNPLLSGVTFSGGEPFCQAQALFAVAEKLQGKKHLMAYSGYTWEQLLELPDPWVLRLLQKLTILVDGPFIETQKGLELRFRGSSNQRVLDVPASLAAGQAVWLEGYQI